VRLCAGKGLVTANVRGLGGPEIPPQRLLPVKRPEQNFAIVPLMTQGAQAHRWSIVSAVGSGSGAGRGLGGDLAGGCQGGLDCLQVVGGHAVCVGVLFG
jgi:hypothetical protein